MTDQDRRRLMIVAVPMVVTTVAGLFAMALTPVLVRDAPLLLLLLESRNRYLLLVAAKVEFVPFLVIGVLRRFLSDPFYYLLGYWYGDRAVRWMERRAGGSFFALDVQRWFSRLAVGVVVLFPGALVSVLAGATGMGARRFIVLNLLGSLGAVLVLWRVADLSAGPLAALVGFSDRNAGWLTAVFVGVTALWLTFEWRRGRRPVEGTDLREALAEPDGQSETPR